MTSILPYSLVLGIYIPNRNTALAVFCLGTLLYWALSAWMNRSETSSNHPTAEPRARTLTPDIEQVVRARFQPAQPKTSTDAIRPSPDELAERRD